MRGYKDDHFALKTIFKGRQIQTEKMPLWMASLLPQVQTQTLFSAPILSSPNAISTPKHCRAMQTSLEEKILVKPLNISIFLLLSLSGSSASRISPQKRLKNLYIKTIVCHHLEHWVGLLSSDTALSKPKSCCRAIPGASMLAWAIYSLISALKKWEVLVTQSCPTLCNPTDCSPPGSSVGGILQAGILEWLAIPISRGSP